MAILSTKTSIKYTHLELGQDVEIGIAGYYTPEKEERLKYDGREVLYVVGRAVVESPCARADGTCTAGNWIYAIVPGYIVNWQNSKDEAGLPVSEVAPIADEAVQTDLRHIIETEEAASIIGFW